MTQQKYVLVVLFCSKGRKPRCLDQRGWEGSGLLESDPLEAVGQHVHLQDVKVDVWLLFSLGTLTK